MLKRLAFVLLIVVLVCSTAGLASATTPALINEAGARMLTLGLVKGVDATGKDLALNANLSRAQLVTILVRAFGQEANSKYLSGAAAFTDTANHPWASGYIAMAKRIIAERSNGKEAIGLPDGSFNPDGNVTVAEAVTFLMKFLGAPTDTTKSWPNNYINGALNAGLITEADKAVLDGIKNTPATRGLAFYLADRAFYNYKLAEGGTVYTTFVDPKPPVITLGSTETETQAASVTITGQVSESATLKANDQAVPLNADHQFSYTMALAEGPNTVTFTATDIAGNKSLPAAVTITRKGGRAVTQPKTPDGVYGITVAVGTGRVPVNHPAKVTVSFTVDGLPAEDPPAYTVTVDPSLGTYDPKTGIFTASREEGTGKVVVEAEGDLKAEADVTVFNDYRVFVNPNFLFAAPGDMIPVTAWMSDYLGNEKAADKIEWSVTAGQIDAEGYLTVPDMKGPLTITATVEGKTGTASIWVGTGQAKIEANVPKLMKPGESVRIAIAVMQDGVSVEAPVYVSSTIGTWDEETQTLTAQDKPGKGTVTIWAGNVGQEFQVEVVGR